MVSRRVAPVLTLSTISPFLTWAAGTRVCAFTLTARYGVRPLSPHHSQMARIKYGLADCSDIAKGYYTRAWSPAGWIARPGMAVTRGSRPRKERRSGTQCPTG